MADLVFGPDWTHKDDFNDLARELAEGRLPGRWGLVQQLVGHWAIAKPERGWMRYGKAALDSVGSVLSYIESQKEMIDGGADPSISWLIDNGYVKAFPDASYSFEDFLCQALIDLNFVKKTIRTPTGQAVDSLLLAFDYAPDKTAYFIDKKGNAGRKGGQPGTSSTWSWDGPYAVADQVPTLIEFIRNHVWNRMGTNTLLLSQSDAVMINGVKLGTLSDTFDFCPAEDEFNDVVQLAGRCKSFLDTGRCRNLLFWGPPGTGKSTLARAIARELDKRVVVVDHEAVRRMSSSAHKIISLLQPGVLILNDIDRGKQHNASLLQSLETHQQNPLLTCLTANDISQLDPAILRPGRTHEVRQIPEPSKQSRARILDYYIGKFNLKLTKAARKTALDRSDSFSPADIKEFCETALAVGVDIALSELGRIRKQRELYAGDRCQEFNRTHSGLSEADY